MDDKIKVKYVEPTDWSWVPPVARTLDEAFRMASQPPKQITRAELEALFPTKLD